MEKHRLSIYSVFQWLPELSLYASELTQDVVQIRTPLNLFFLHNEKAYRIFLVLSFESLMDQLQTGYLTFVLDERLKVGIQKTYKIVRTLPI